MFQKTAETEAATVLNERAKIARIFDRLGKPEASELEILRAAKEMGLSLKGVRLSEFCTTNGTNLSLKG